ncbi:hypothetical protein [Flavobacterium gyeonganense]|uniref:Uncharacterized protein n=1 Tax=Flavobacterium gyeonganense TaxID=1310418 RepID=A0ABV5HG25_9FLAO|nr:hypothetical protein [Flavobacterium gyeonganense]
MRNIEKLQTLLPLGYIFLVILGIIKESIYYYQLGINITPYSSIMDILISPIATITSHPIFMICIILIFILHYKLPKLLVKYHHKEWVQKTFELKNTSIEKKSLLSEDEITNEYILISIKTLCSILISLFLGFGIGGGYFLSKKIERNELKYNYKLNYNDSKSENVYIIGTNTSYYFYLTEGSSTVKIAPVASIRNLEIIKNKMLTK